MQKRIFPNQGYMRGDRHVLPVRFNFFILILYVKILMFIDFCRSILRFVIFFVQRRFYNKASYAEYSQKWSDA